MAGVLFASIWSKAQVMEIVKLVRASSSLVIADSATQGMLQAHR